MKKIDRTMVIFMALSWTILAIFMIILALGWDYPLIYLHSQLQDVNNRWMFGLTGCLILIIGLVYFMTSVRVKPTTNTIISNSKLGIVSITLPALENLASKVTKMQNGIRDVKPEIKPTPNGIATHISITVTPDTNIPDITLKVQEAIKDSFKKTAGIDVEEVRVLVNKISYDTKTRVE